MLYETTQILGLVFFLTVFDAPLTVLKDSKV